MSYEGKSDAYRGAKSVEKQFFGHELGKEVPEVRESYPPTPSVQPEPRDHEVDPEVEFFGEPLEQRVRD